MEQPKFKKLKPTDYFEGFENGDMETYKCPRCGVDYLESKMSHDARQKSFDHFYRTEVRCALCEAYLDNEMEKDLTELKKNFFMVFDNYFSAPIKYFFLDIGRAWKVFYLLIKRCNKKQKLKKRLKMRENWLKGSKK